MFANRLSSRHSRKFAYLFFPVIHHALGCVSACEIHYPLDVRIKEDIDSLWPGKAVSNNIYYLKHDETEHLCSELTAKSK